MVKHRDLAGAIRALGYRVEWPVSGDLLLDGHVTIRDARVTEVLAEADDVDRAASILHNDVVRMETAR